MSRIFHSTTSSSSSRSSNVCLIFEPLCGPTDRRGRSTFAYEVFSIDVSPSSSGAGRRNRSPSHSRRRIPPKVLRSPLFEIPHRFPSGMSFFTFHSKIYFVGGFVPGGLGTWSRDVFVYDTSSPGIKKEVHRMNRGKSFPVVIGPVNDKVYMMSSYITDINFEVFDPKFGTWYLPTQPTVPRPPTSLLDTQYRIRAYVAVGNGRKIILSTESSGLFIYDTVEENWSHSPEGSLPFNNGAVPIGGDHFLAFRYSKKEKTMVLGTYFYNSNENAWYDFQVIWVISKHHGYLISAYPVSLGDGLVCGVLSKYDRPCDYDDDFIDLDKPIEHTISIGVFRALPNQEEVGGLTFEPVFFGEYEDRYDMKDQERWIPASYPLLDVSHLLPEAEHLEGSVTYLAEASLRAESRSKRKRSDGRAPAGKGHTHNKHRKTYNGRKGRHGKRCGEKHKGSCGKRYFKKD